MPDTPSVETGEETSSNIDLNLDDPLAMSDLELAQFSGEYASWDDVNLDFSDLLNSPKHSEPVQPLPSQSSSLVRHSISLHDQGVQAQSATTSDVSIPAQPSRLVRSLVKRTRMKTGAPGIVNLMHRTLMSYPLMMLRHDILPPFFHPHLISTNADNNYMEPLNNCISLFHMTSSGVQGSRKLFWKNVRLECERMSQEVCQVCHGSRDSQWADEWV